MTRIIAAALALTLAAAGATNAQPAFHREHHQRCYHHHHQHHHLRQMQRIER